MMRILIRKCLFACLCLLLVMTISFWLLQTIPGNPFQQEQTLPEEIYQGLMEYHGLKDSIFSQYLRYLKQLLLFDFGPSLVYNRTVAEIIKDGFPVSALLGAESLIIAISLGILFGAFAAIKKGSPQDSAILSFSILGVSIPSFILAAILQYVLAIKLNLFPVARWGTFMQSILPALSLSILPAAFIARMTRATLINELQQSYIRTAYSKGLSRSIVIFRHALRNTLAPVLSYLGPLTANILTGSFIIEKIYAIPGLGYWFVASVSNRDYPLIMGITIFYCTILLLANLLAEFICILLDRRLINEV